MSDLLSILDELEATPSRNEKIEILTRHKNNHVLKDVFFYALNPMISFNIRAIPDYITRPDAKSSVETLLADLHKFADRTYSGHAAINHLTNLLANMTYRDSVVGLRVISRDLRCGVAASTVNKIWKNLIPEWPCLLGEDQSKIKIKKYPYYSQTKFDGVRANALCVFSKTRELSVTMYGRSGKMQDFNTILESKIANDFASLDMPSFVLDGELVVVDDFGKILPRKTGNGIINKAIKGTISDAEADRVRFAVWDIIDYNDFNNHFSLVPYSERLKLLYSVVPKENSVVTAAVTTLVNDDNEVSVLFADALSDGLEGIMLKSPDLLWENTRSKEVIKFKAEKEADLRVIGWKEGNGKYKGMLGALVCATEDGMLQVSVSGFSDEQRALFTDEYIVNKIITVLYNEIIDSDTTQCKSLFLPRFIEVRDDKDKANLLSDLA